MNRHLWLATLVAVLIGGGWEVSAGQPCCPPPEESFLARLKPVGGWHPYDGKLLHWWDPHCFPCCGGADDYCRKPLPCVCWPPYPPYYIWGAEERCYPQIRCGESK